ncbi:hypothetical protein MXMO3_03514 (plasmid) [Maritalea myrionectae]|uniref:Uncharacterized protein n=1 Tax=Maritalea myrionectae TaxID=454601 RepID=A0A2R4MJ56_9HYPH|nr:hypothetical protein MXMO3_03514 [Maritalea myrionectae]
MLRLIFSTIAILLSVEFASADTCAQAVQTCSSRSTITVAGVPITSVCTSVARTEDCVRDVPENTCETFDGLVVPGSTPLGDNQCHLVSETCVRSTAGVCDKYEKVYNCWNGPGDVPSTTLLSRDFHNFDENLTDNCSALEGDANCSLDRTETSQGADTRDINELAVSRSWWQKTRVYDCTDNNFEDTCDAYEDSPVCTAFETPSCLAYAPDGSCQYQQWVYECDGDSSFEANCEAINVCIGDNCDGIEQEPSNDYPESAAWLNFLDDLAKTSACEANETSTDTGTGDGGDGGILGGGTGTDTGTTEEEECGTVDEPNLDRNPEIFGGEILNCDFHVTKNCCSDAYTDGRCNDDERTLKDRRDAGAAHYMGLGCAYRVLGICLTEHYEYCTYKSKFARVFQEQAHKQTGAQFRWLTSDPCPALTLEQLESLDVNQMDLSEVFGDMLNNVDQPVEEFIVEQLQNEMGGYLGQAQDTLE